MRASELRQNSLIQLKEICKGNKIKYRGYSKYKKKEDLIKFILKTLRFKFTYNINCE